MEKDSDFDPRMVCVPGQRLCVADEKHTAGSGTYSRHGYIHACVAGIVKVHQLGDKTTSIDVYTGRGENVVPLAGDVVTARVMQVNPRWCKCSILCVKNAVLAEPFRGILRREDVRATEKDRVEMYKSVRPGDVILARVLSLGDAHSYILSTAENELGVVIAYSEAGVAMIPVGWQEMQCPRTYSKEFRKVAKVTPESSIDPKHIQVTE